MCLVGLLVLLAGGAPTAYAGPAIRPLPVGTDVDYQLGGAWTAPAHVGIVVRDRGERPQAGRYGVCYVNAFQTQPDEQAFWRRHPDLVLRRGGKPVVDSAWGENLLDLRTSAKRAALASRPSASVLRFARRWPASSGRGCKAAPRRGTPPRSWTTSTASAAPTGC